MKLRGILIFTSFTICLVLVINISEYYFITKRAFDDFYKRLEIRAIVATRARFEEEDLSKSAYDQIRKEHLETLVGEQEHFIKLNIVGGKTVPDTVMVSDAFMNAAITKGQSRTRQGGRFYLAQLYEDHLDDDEKIRYVTVLSARSEFLEDYLDNLRNIFIVSCLLTIAMSVILGAFFSRIFMKPIKVISRRMRDISANKLHLRLDDNKKANDEMSMLTGTFNDMLDRLEIAFESQKNFISNASHEFNTPLTAIIGEAEYALAKTRSADDYEKAICAMYAQAERLKNITASLLQIAQTGYDGERQPFSTLRIDEVVYKAKEVVEKMNPDSNIMIDASLMPDNNILLEVKGNEELLEVGFVNIMINACKYSDNKPVSVTIAASNKSVIIILQDRGVGIPENELKYIYDPFFRASNTKDFKGYGIGLPLTRNIVKLHGGVLEVYSKQDKGTKVKIILPIAAL